MQAYFGKNINEEQNNHAPEVAEEQYFEDQWYGNIRYAVEYMAHPEIENHGDHKWYGALTGGGHVVAGNKTERLHEQYAEKWKEDGRTRNAYKPKAQLFRRYPGKAVG